MNKKREAAVIPAAGLSSRMQAFKPLVTIAGKTNVERVIELFRKAGVNDIVIVIPVNGLKGDVHVWRKNIQEGYTFINEFLSTGQVLYARHRD